MRPGKGHSNLKRKSDGTRKEKKGKNTTPILRAVFFAFAFKALFRKQLPSVMRELCEEGTAEQANMPAQASSRVQCKSNTVWEQRSLSIVAQLIENASSHCQSHSGLMLQ